LKKIHTLVAVVGVAVAGGAAWWWQHQPAKAAAGMAVAGASAGATAGAGNPSAAAPGAAGRPAGGGPGGGGPATVEVAKAEALTLTDDVQAVGSLKSAQGVMLRPEVAGRIAKLGFADGARVRRGQLLVQLDDTLQQAQIKQADAQASIARTNLQRSRELQAQGFVSQSAVDQNAAALQVADAQVSLAQAQAARMKVLAPFDGTAGLRLVDVGDYVKDGADIVNIEDLAALKVQFAVPERYVDRLRAGQAVELMVDALPGRKFKGRVEAVDSQVDANGRALQVLAKVDNTGALLKPGMFARPRVVFAVREGAVVVPEEALVPLGTRQLLFKVVDGANGQKVAQRLEAKVGLRLPGKVEILEGVKAGDNLVTAGHARLLRGDNLPVRPIDLSRGPAAGKGGGKAGGSAAGPASGGAGPAADAGAKGASGAANSPSPPAASAPARP
jgi:membrane fusion protein (multidrug efflux system)